MGEGMPYFDRNANKNIYIREKSFFFSLCFARLKNQGWKTPFSSI
jgi:hypothetical protein